MCRIVMSEGHGIKGRANEDLFQALQEQCFLWEREGPVGADVGLFNFQDL